MTVSGRLAALHIASLWCIAVAQPLFDVLRGSPEFFVAHDTGPANLVGFVLLCCLAGTASRGGGAPSGTAAEPVMCAGMKSPTGSTALSSSGASTVTSISVAAGG